MANMSYCRFENTYHDLVDCEENFSSDDLSETEEKYRLRLLKLCRKIADNYGDLEDEND